MKNEIKKSMKWALPLAVITFVLAAVFSIVSTPILNGGVASGITVILVIILIALVFDLIGVAATAASEVPFHAMAAKKVSGARYAVWLTKNADRVNTFCTDVIGDISSIVSGTAAAAVVVQMVAGFAGGHGGYMEYAVSVFVTGVVSALTVFVKALGKTYAIKYATKIIFRVGYLIYFTEQHLHIPILKVLDAKKGRKSGKRKEKKVCDH